MSDVSASDNRLQRLAVFIELEKRLRSCSDLAALGFTLVNETHSLTPYRQAMLWHNSGGIHGRLLAVSGLATPDPSAPFASWMRRVAHFTSEHTTAPADVTVVAPESLPDELSVEWSQWLPAQLIRIPLYNARQQLRAVLLLAREQAWTDAEITLLTYLGGAASHAWNALDKQQRRLLPGQLYKRRWWLGFAVMLIGLGFVPVTQTTLAPGEVIARDPFVVRAGIDGVIDRIHVEPNQVVTSDTLLVSMDKTRLQNQLEVARRGLEVADAEYRQAAQQGLFDNRANASLAILKGRADQRLAEVTYLEQLLQRVEIRAGRDGVVIFDDASEWEGRPVAIGERVMMLADPDSTELEIKVPVADAIALENGARVRMFLNTRPHSPLDAELRFASYQAELTPEGILAYRLVASFGDDMSAGQNTLIRIGLKGTAKLYGERTFLLVYLLRRPLTSLRQMVGL